MLHLIVTEDGSHTLRNDKLNETYHSVHGAIQESNHVYIKNGLHFYVEQLLPQSLKILEVGFGTGLNALLTCLDQKAKQIPIIYHAVEAFPISMEIVSQLNYPSCLGQRESLRLMLNLHEALWNESTSIRSNFDIHKFHERIETLILERESYDLVYFDAFAPAKQPDVWNFKVLSHVIRAIKPGGVLVTYCARGQFKRDLKSLGMKVNSLPGPPGKLEMVQAIRHIFK